MAPRVFYSFHYAKDAFRAAKIRGIGVVEGNQPCKDNDWESVTRGGDRAIENWIDRQMEGRTCAIILVGPETARRKWIDHEIIRAWNKKIGLLGIRIHKILDHHHQPAPPGENPFASIGWDNGRRLSDFVTVYDPPGANSAAAYAHIEANIDSWIKDAIRARK